MTQNNSQDLVEELRNRISTLETALSRHQNNEQVKLKLTLELLKDEHLGSQPTEAAKRIEQLHSRTWPDQQTNSDGCGIAWLGNRDSFLSLLPTRALFDIITRLSKRDIGCLEMSAPCFSLPQPSLPRVRSLCAHCSHVVDKMFCAYKGTLFMPAKAAKVKHHLFYEETDFPALYEKVCAWVNDNLDNPNQLIDICVRAVAYNNSNQANIIYWDSPHGNGRPLRKPSNLQVFTNGRFNDKSWAATATDVNENRLIKKHVSSLAAVVVHDESRTSSEWGYQTVFAWDKPEDHKPILANVKHQIFYEQTPFPSLYAKACAWVNENLENPNQLIDICARAVAYNSSNQVNIIYWDSPQHNGRPLREPSELRPLFNRVNGSWVAEAASDDNNDALIQKHARYLAAVSVHDESRRSATWGYISVFVWGSSLRPKKQS